MIGATSGGPGLSSASGISLTLAPFPALRTSGISGSLTGAEGAGASGQSTATISGPGQLLSSLQQLQSQNPKQFTQVVSQIASQLQAAAQQAQGPQSTFLASLAARFQKVAQGGSLSQLQPSSSQHHHHARQAYSQGTQGSSGSLAALSPAGSSQSSTSLSSSFSSLQQLFANIMSKVTAALSS